MIIHENEQLLCDMKWAIIMLHIITSCHGNRRHKLASHCSGVRGDSLRVRPEQLGALLPKNSCKQASLELMQLN